MHQYEYEYEYETEIAICAPAVTSYLLSPLHACFVEIATAKYGATAAQMTNLMFVKSYSYSFSSNRNDEPLYF
jgi:hypothetical protein